MSVIVEIERLFAARGDEQYIRDQVTQREHALQAATRAEEEGAPPDLIVAALLHDVGHLLEDPDAVLAGTYTDARHEETGTQWLARYFGPRVTEPVRLHVKAKRYLCAVDPAYLEVLSPASVRSLEVQGGPLGAQEVSSFEQHPFHREALWLRRIDDRSKVRGAPVPGLDDFFDHIQTVVPFGVA